MKHSRALRTITCAIALGAGAATVFAQEDVAAPPVRTDHDIEYRSGGVGTDEREALFAVAEDYGLKLVFAAEDKSDYHADVAVSVADRAGQTIFEASNTGPYLFVALPPGKYELTAKHGDEAKSKSVTVAQGKQTAAAFYW